MGRSTQYIIPPERTARVRPTKKEAPDVLDLPPSLGEKRLAYFALKRLIENTFATGETPSVTEIYKYVTAPMGLSYDDTEILVRRAIKEGYLKSFGKGRIKITGGD